MAPSVAVIIRTKNEEEFIGEALEAVCTQSKRPDEIIIVDSGSTDSTLKIAGRYKTEIISIDPARFTYGGALNAGCAQAGSDVCVSLSADAKPADENWLATLTEPLGESRTAGVYGRQIPRPLTNPLERRDILTCYGRHRKVQSTDHFFSNVNSAIKREVWRSTRFSETLPAAEDWHWARRVQEKGYVVVYEPDAAVYHSDDDRLMGVFRRTKRVSFGGAVLNPGMHVSLPQMLSEAAGETAKDFRFIAESGMDIKAMLYSPLYRLVRSLGRYEGVRHGKRTGHPH